MFVQNGAVWDYLCNYCATRISTASVALLEEQAGNITLQ